MGSYWLTELKSLGVLQGPLDSFSNDGLRREFFLLPSLLIFILLGYTLLLRSPNGSCSSSSPVLPMQVQNFFPRSPGFLVASDWLMCSIPSQALWSRECHALSPVLVTYSTWGRVELNPRDAHRLRVSR